MMQYQIPAGSTIRRYNGKWEDVVTTKTATYDEHDLHQKWQPNNQGVVFIDLPEVAIPWTMISFPVGTFEI